MTNDERADLARLREIAEEGRRLPLLGGWHMIVWGSAVIAATLFHWAVASRALPVPMMAIAGGWFAMPLIALIAARLLPGARNPRHDVGNRVERAVWRYGGSLLGVLGLTLFAGFWMTTNHELAMLRAFLFALLPAVSFGVYAIALSVTAEASGVAALKPYALIALGFAAVTAFLAGSLWQFPATAIGLMLVAILPGSMLVALERRHG